MYAHLIISTNNTLLGRLDTSAEVALYDNEGRVLDFRDFTAPRGGRRATRNEAMRQTAVMAAAYGASITGPQFDRVVAPGMELYRIGVRLPKQSDEQDQ